MLNRSILYLAAVFCCSSSNAAAPVKKQESVTFEMRLFTPNPQADGLTDFHGETELLSTEERVEILNHYANFASRFWGDPGLNKPLFKEDDVRTRLATIKPQPTTSVRQTIRLDKWRAYGYKKGKDTEQARQRELWTAAGACIREGCLVLDGNEASPVIPPLAWRFRMKAWLSQMPTGLSVHLNGGNTDTIDIPIGSIQEFEIYGDLANRRLFLSSEGNTIRQIPVPASFEDAVTSFSIRSLEGRASVDRFSLYNFIPQPDNKHTPYRMEMVYDEDFEPIPRIEGWQETGYDDSTWKEVSLPSPHGGLRGAGESYYLRTKVQVGDFRKASLEIETLDPAGEVWVNGQPVAVLTGRIPRSIEVGEYLVPNSENVIAVRVKPYYAHHSMLHTPSDHNVGWFLGRTSLVLNKEECSIAEGLVHTLSLSPTKAVQHHQVRLTNPTPDAQKRQLEVNYYPWFPEEDNRVATLSREVILLPQTDNLINLDLDISNPVLWSPDAPSLYKVEFILKDEKGQPTDDWVTTTGIRFIEQKEGVLYINHKPEMLNGAQNFGYRRPLETVSTTIRCGTDEMVLRDLMMAKYLGGNLLRIHVHAEGYTLDGINDPRFAEYADQLGLYLIWQTAGWIREGETSLIDVKNYPLYIRQVFNHPSIAMWEGSNHPNRYKEHPSSETTRFFSEMTRAMIETDSSRLVSPSSHWQNSHINSYDGSIDYQGNPMTPPYGIMHRMMTRGNQDAYSGYGSNWSSLRHIPTAWARKCLDAHDLCYFNFEHEESAAQPNWTLAQKEPWYEVQSYEWPYEEGSIGRKLQTAEWRASQAYQAFSAWESMKMQMLAGISGFSWCSLESGPNMFTYQKPLIDPFCVPKLAFYANRMAFQKIWAGSDDVDTTYGPNDQIRPVIFNMDGECTATLTVELQNEKGRVLERKVFSDIQVPQGRSVTKLNPFRFKRKGEGCHFIVYKLTSY